MKLGLERGLGVDQLAAGSRILLHQFVGRLG